MRETDRERKPNKWYWWIDKKITRFICVQSISSDWMPRVCVLWLCIYMGRDWAFEDKIPHEMSAFMCLYITYSNYTVCFWTTSVLLYILCEKLRFEVDVCALLFCCSRYRRHQHDCRALVAIPIVLSLKWIARFAHQPEGSVNDFLNRKFCYYHRWYQMHTDSNSSGNSKSA